VAAVNRAFVVHKVGFVPKSLLGVSFVAVSDTQNDLPSAIVKLGLIFSPNQRSVESLPLMSGRDNRDGYYSFSQHLFGKLGEVVGKIAMRPNPHHASRKLPIVLKENGHSLPPMRVALFRRHLDAIDEEIWAQLSRSHPRGLAQLALSSVRRAPCFFGGAAGVQNGINGSDKRQEADGSAGSHHLGLFKSQIRYGFARFSRPGLLYQVLRFEAVLLCGLLAAISFYRGFPPFKPIQPRWVTAGASWAILGVTGLLHLAA
jgi:hypothetical protein